MKKLKYAFFYNMFNYLESRLLYNKQQDFFENVLQRFYTSFFRAKNLAKYTYSAIQKSTNEIEKNNKYKLNYNHFNTINLSD